MILMEIPSAIYISLLNFALFVGLLTYLLRKPLREFLASRHERIKLDIENASMARAEAEERFKAICIKLSHIESEIDSMMKEFRQEGEREKAVIIDQAKKFALKLKDETSRMINQEMRKAEESLQTRTVNIAISLAEKMLRDNMTPEDQARMSRAYIERLERLN